MQPALTPIQNDVRAADLRARANREPRYARRRRSTDPTSTETAHASTRAAFFTPLLLRHGFFGREHGSHA
jgi:hypothetical protein